MSRTFKKFNSTDYEMSKLQDNIDQAFTPLLRSALTDGIILKNVPVTTGGATINHKLDRQPLGWFIVDKTSNIDIWRTAWNRSTITLQSSSNGSIDIWIF